MSKDEAAKPARGGSARDASASKRDGASVPSGGAFDEQELRDLVALGADWVWETDEELNFSWLSPEFETVTGVDPTDVLGRNRVHFLVQVSSVSKSAGAHFETMQARKPFRNFVYRLKGSRQDSRWISVSGNPRFAADGSFIGYRGVGHNVTALAASFEELQEIHSQIAGTEVRDKVFRAARAGDSQLERMMDALDVMSDAFCYYEASGSIVLYNEALLSMYGGLADVIRPGLTFAQLVDAGLERGYWDLEGMPPAQWREKALSGRTDPAGFRWMIKLADGRVYIHREVRTADGGTIATCTDITEMESRRAELARASETSRQLLSDLERSLDSMQMGVVLLDADLNATIINQAFYQLWEISPEHVPAGSPFRALLNINRHAGIYHVAAERWEDYVESRLAEIRAGDVAPREFRRLDGRTMIYSVTSLSEGKRLVCYYDVSEMKNREAEIAAALERSRLAELAINSVTDPIFVKDENLRFVLVNDAFAAIFDTSPADMLGRLAIEFLPADDVAEFERSERHVLATGERYEVEETFEEAGETRSRIVQKNRVQVENGRNFVACVVFDVTEIMRRETEAIQARQRLADVLDMLPAGVFIYDNDDTFLFANKVIRESMPAMKPAWQTGRSFREAMELGHSLGYFRTSGDLEIDALYDADADAWVDAMLAHYRRSNVVFERSKPDGR